MKFTIGILFFINAIGLRAQSYPEEAKIFASFKLDAGMPSNLLASRSAVFYDLAMAETELQSTQKAFQQTGIDAVSYFEIASSMAGIDCRNATLKYLLKRDIRFLIFIRKVNDQVEFYITNFNGKIDFIEVGQPTWFVHKNVLNDALREIFQTAIATEKKQNFLINDLPEYISAKEAKPITGRRNETLTTDIGYFLVAFPKIGNEAADKELEQFLKENYSGKYEVVDLKTEEGELRKKNFVYVMRYVHAKGALAKNVLDYVTTKSESAIASATFVNGELQIKTIPSDEEVYKFYFKKLETGEVFLGKWDADVTWQEALGNHINAYKAERKLK